jgi:hypothetical protein
VAYVARVNDTRGGKLVSPNRRDGVGRAWRSLDSIVGEQYDERGSASQLSNFKSGQGVIIDGKAVAQADGRAGGGCGRGVFLPPGVRGCTPRKFLLSQMAVDEF